MDVQIDWPRAELVCGQLLTALRAKTFPYGETWALPQTFIPERIKSDSLLHARFLFYTCHYMRGTIKSDHAVRRLVTLWKTHPEFFDPLYVSSLNSIETLFEELDRLIGYKTKEIAPFWKENSRRLATHWGGDPRRIFDSVTNAEEMYRVLTNKAAKKVVHEHEQGFFGFQKKMASMLAYFLMEAGLVAPFTASPPVDFHLVRVLLATRVLTVSDMGVRKLRYDHLTPKGIEVLERYGHEHNENLVELGNALWMLSVVLCSQAPGNGSSGRRKGVHGKKIYPKRVDVLWSNPQHVTAYLGS